MHLKEFSEMIASIAEEVGCDGGTSIASHQIPSHVAVCVEGDEDTDYELVAIETDRLGNCGCAVGLTLCIKKIMVQCKPN